MEFSTCSDLNEYVLHSPKTNGNGKRARFITIDNFYRQAVVTQTFFGLRSFVKSEFASQNYAVTQVTASISLPTVSAVSSVILWSYFWVCKAVDPGGQILDCDCSVFWISDSTIAVRVHFLTIHVSFIIAVWNDHIFAKNKILIVFFILLIS